jgi:hypothetical protein
MPTRDRQGGWVRDDWLRDVSGGRWVADAWVTIRKGRLLVGELRVFPLASAPALPGQPWKGGPDDVPAGGIDRRLLGVVPAGRYAPLAAAWATETAGQPDFHRLQPGDPHVSLSLLNLALPGISELVKTGQRLRPRRHAGRADRWYAKLSQEFIERLAKRSIKPVTEIARRRGKMPEQIRDWLHEARSRGILSKARPGKREGHLTEYGLSLLQAPTTTTSQKTRKERPR